MTNQTKSDSFSYEIVDKQIKMRIASGIDASNADSFLFEVKTSTCTLLYLLHDAVLQRHDITVNEETILNTIKRQKLMRIEEVGVEEPYAFIAVNKAIFENKDGA